MFCFVYVKFEARLRQTFGDVTYKLPKVIFICVVGYTSFELNGDGTVASSAMMALNSMVVNEIIDGKYND